MKINKAKNWKKRIAIIGGVGLVLGFSTPLIINIATKRKPHEEEVVDAFEPGWDKDIERLSGEIFSFNKEGTEFTNIPQLAYGYQEEVMPTEVILPKPEDSSDYLIIDGATYPAKENTRWWSSALPTAPVYKHSTYTNDNLIFTMDYKEALGYIAEIVPPSTMIPKPTDDNDLIVIDGIDYSATETSLVWDKQLPNRHLYEYDGPNGDGVSFTIIEEHAKDWEREIKQVKPKLNGVEIGSLEGGSEYDSTLWEWDMISPPSVPQQALKEIKPTINYLEITASDGGDPYDSSLWTWEIIEKGTPGIDATPAIENKIRVDEQSSYVSLPSNVVKPGSKYDPSLWTYSDVLSVDHRYVYAGGKPKKVKYQTIDIFYAGIKIETKEIPWLSTIDPVYGLDENDPDHWVPFNFDMFGGALKTFEEPVIQNVPLYPHLNSSIHAEGVELVPPMSGDDPQIWKSLYNGTHIATHTFPYLGSVVENPPIDGEAHKDFDQNTYVEGRKQVEQSDDIPAIYRPVYDGIPITTLEDLIVENNGSIIGEHPGKKVPEDFELSMWEKGNMFKPETKPAPVIIEIEDFRNKKIYIHDTSAYETFSTIIGLGWDKDKPHAVDFYQLSEKEYTSDVTKHPTYKEESIPEPYDIYGSINVPNTNISIYEKDGSVYDFTTASERYVFDVTNNHYYYVNEDNNEYTTDETKSFDYRSLIIPNSITGNGDNWDDSKLKVVALLREDQTIEVINSITGAKQAYTWLTA